MGLCGKPALVGISDSAQFAHMKKPINKFTHLYFHPINLNSNTHEHNLK